MSVDEVASLIVGHVGTRVQLTLCGNGGGDIRTADLIRNRYEEDTTGGTLSDAPSDQEDSGSETATPRSARSYDDW